MVKYYGRARQRIGSVNTNQIGLKMSGCPSKVGRQGYLSRYIARRSQCNLKFCGEVLYNGPGLVLRVNNTRCIPRAPRGQSFNSGVGHKSTPRFSCNQRCSVDEKVLILPPKIILDLGPAPDGNSGVIADPGSSSPPTPLTPSPTIINLGFTNPNIPGSLSTAATQKFSISYDATNNKLNRNGLLYTRDPTVITDGPLARAEPYFFPNPAANGLAWVFLKESGDSPTGQRLARAADNELSYEYFKWKEGGEREGTWVIFLRQFIGGEYKMVSEAIKVVFP